jgi:NADH-quinone oxidoreductase subunit K
MTSSLDNYLIVGAILFVLGAVGFLTRRNLILMMLSAELMLHGVSLNLVAFSHEYGNNQGQVFTIFVLTVAACEAALALALILALYQQRKTLDIRLWHDLGEEEPPPPPAAGEAPPAHKLPVFPRLTPAGRVPELSPQETATHV